MAASYPPPESDPFIIGSIKRTLCACLIIFAKKDRPEPQKAGKTVTYGLATAVAVIVMVVLGINPHGIVPF